METETLRGESRSAKRGAAAQQVIDLDALERGVSATALGEDDDVPSMLPKPAAKPKGIRSTVEMAAQIGQRLPGLLAQLRETGAGAVRPMDPAELAETVRVAYDPDAALAIEQARAAGEDSGVTWETAGPVAQVESWDACATTAAPRSPGRYRPSRTARCSPASWSSCSHRTRAWPASASRSSTGPTTRPRRPRSPTPTSGPRTAGQPARASPAPRSPWR